MSTADAWRTSAGLAGSAPALLVDGAGARRPPGTVAATATAFPEGVLASTREGPRRIDPDWLYVHGLADAVHVSGEFLLLERLPDRCDSLLGEVGPDGHYHLTAGNGTQVRRAATAEWHAFVRVLTRYAVGDPGWCEELTWRAQR